MDGDSWVRSRGLEPLRRPIVEVQKCDFYDGKFRRSVEEEESDEKMGRAWIAKLGLRGAERNSRPNDEFVRIPCSVNRLAMSPMMFDVFPPKKWIHLDSL